MARKKYIALEIKQWLSTWNEAEWNEEMPKPPESFFVTSMDIRTLRALSGVPRRRIDARKKKEWVPGYQRALDNDRTKEINKYLKYGYPLSSSGTLNPDENKNLIKPGWLPNGVLANIIPAEKGERFRAGKDVKLPKSLEVTLEPRKDGTYEIDVPDLDEPVDIDQDTLFPFEIIDGQHRLFSIDSEGLPEGHYDVPLIVFYGLEPSWQAYLFWMINVAPKRINTSLAYDLYPELRKQDWLERGEAVKVYREHRSQELTELLWRHPESPWKDRIELFGHRVKGHVSNAAFIRSLTATFVKPWKSGDKIGGLFGSQDRQGKEYVLPWSRAQQGAFLIYLWQSILDSVRNSNSEWVKAFGNKNNVENLPAAFAGENSLLATDQGVRAVCVVFNAVTQLAVDEFPFEEWAVEDTSGDFDEDATIYLNSIKENEELVTFVSVMARDLVNGCDWRTSKAPGLSDEDAERQMRFKGSSGYKELSIAALQGMIESGDELSRAYAENAINALGWADG